MGNCMTTPTPPKVLVLGASGYVGKATLSSLVERHGSKLEVFAGVRNPDKFPNMKGVNVVQADMGDDPKALAQVLKDFDRVYVVTPGHEDRTKLVLNTVSAIKTAGVEFTLFLSVATVNTDSIFGRQFKPIEKAVKTSDLPGYAIVRLPLFIDNMYANVQSIKNNATFYDPRHAFKAHTPVAVADVGKASADILAKPKKHLGKTYTLAMPAYHLIDFSKAMSKAVGKQILVTTVTYEKAKESFMAMGFPEWQVDGIMELYKSIDNGKSETLLSKYVGDIQRITGEKATTMEQWVAQNAAGFQ